MVASVSSHSPLAPVVPVPVVVAVAGDGSEAAVRFGAAEAVRSAAPLHLVHVVDLVPWREPHVLGVTERAARKAEVVLWDAVSYARSLVADAIAVTSELFHGEVVPGLVEVGQEGRVLVLERRTGPDLPERAVCAKVSSASRAPVVCVPSEWRGADGPVLVGVDSPETCHPALLAGLEAAAARGSDLRVLHARWSARDEDHPDHLTTADPGEVETTIREMLASFVRAQPDLDGVTCTVEVTHARPGDLLTEASHDADLLVVGRHDPFVPRGSRLGPVARTVVREAACPVLLLAPTHEVHRWRAPSSPLSTH